MKFLLTRLIEITLVEGEMNIRDAFCPMQKLQELQRGFASSSELIATLEILRKINDLLND